MHCEDQVKYRIAYSDVDHANYELRNQYSVFVKEPRNISPWSVHQPKEYLKIAVSVFAYLTTHINKEIIYSLYSIKDSFEQALPPICNCVKYSLE